jgi:hypothetical protein
VVDTVRMDTRAGLISNNNTLIPIPYAPPNQPHDELTPETPHSMHLLRSSRRNVSPVELIDGPFLMRHEHLAGTLVERREIAQTPSRANGVLHDPPVRRVSG